MNVRALTTGVVLFGGTVGCDPCAGTPACMRQPFVAIAGEIVSPVTRRAVDGVSVSIVRRGGVPMLADSAATVTRAGGHWHLSLDAAEEGDVIVDVIVAAPGLKPYRVSEVRLPTLRRRGEAHVQRRWVPELYFPQVFELFDRLTNTRIVNTPVEFRRTGGAELGGPVPADGIYRAKTNEVGWFRLFSVQTTAAGGGAVVGELTVTLPPPIGQSTSTVALSPSHIYQQLHIYRVDVEAGPSQRHAHPGADYRGVTASDSVTFRMSTAKTGGPGL